MHNHSEKIIVVKAVKPIAFVQYFQKDLFIKPNEQFYIYLSPNFHEQKRRKIKLKIKLSNGVRYSYTLYWDNMTPYID